ncbi:MAG TPA: hypothetical protein VFI30_08140 [Nocardioidaceae bacterium]|nr:hypothetical protein [Nocardioidaceae bacterium]
MAEEEYSDQEALDGDTEGHAWPRDRGDDESGDTEGHAWPRDRADEDDPTPV